tara:strand:+ start:135 stop:338 length:204 start_codon:yes stop_codon:yes gene_type:complete
MLLAFALVVTVNGEVDAKATSYWRSLERCRWFAEELTVQGTRRRYDTPVMAYCVPKYVDPETTPVHE